MRGRFAPSPTGALHFGSLIAALASWLDARSQGGEWLVRIEDVDTPRTVPGAADEILRELEAFGLHWDGEVVAQSRRTARYAEALERLRSMGLVYCCRCSRKEVADSGLRGIEGAIYPGTCRDLALAGPGSVAHRMRANSAAIEFEDRVQGRVRQDISRAIGDFVLKRRDALHGYQLAVVVDDAEQQVTDVVRGADLLQSTPRQILLQRSLGFATPRYLHFPVATDSRGVKLSKQTLASPVSADRAGALLAALEFLSQPAPTSRLPREILAEAVRAWDPARIARRIDKPAGVQGDAATPGGV